jgi:hypothetical protein
MSKLEEYSRWWKSTQSDPNLGILDDEQLEYHLDNLSSYELLEIISNWMEDLKDELEYKVWVEVQDEVDRREN